MSVIAGCSLFDGVLLLADCRATIKRGINETVYVDNVQKLFALTSTTAIGFVGDIPVASIMMKDLLAQLRNKNTNGRAAVSLLEWFPRYFRAIYNKRIIGDRTQPSVAFMVGSVIRDRANVIERAKVVRIMERFRLGKLSHQRNWLPGILVKILQTPPTDVFVNLLDAPLGLLYFMKSPEFVPEHVRPLEFGVLGSGDGSAVQIDTDLDWIFAGDVGNPYAESMALRMSVSSFIERSGIESVGGLYPCLKMDSTGTNFLGYRAEMPIGGTMIELSLGQGQRWVQKNLTSGKEVKLLYPWEFDASEYLGNQKFDDYKDAQNVMRKPVEPLIGT